MYNSIFILCVCLFVRGSKVELFLHQMENKYNNNFIVFIFMWQILIYHEYQNLRDDNVNNSMVDNTFTQININFQE